MGRKLLLNLVQIFSPMKNEVEKLICEYASLYSMFEDLQAKKILPGGDQKTGVIGEYYAKMYLESLDKVKAVIYGQPGSTFDLKATLLDGSERLVQVKCVSAHSKTRRLAPLNLSNGAFDDLYIIKLNHKFFPIEFYINTFDELKGRANGKKKLSALNLPEDSAEYKGRLLNLTENKIDLLRKALE